MTPKWLLLQKSGINRNFPMPLFYCSIKIWAVHWSFGELFCGIFPIRPNLRTEQQCDLERISLSFSSCYPECQHGHRQRCDSERISCAIFHRSRFEIPETKNHSIAHSFQNEISRFNWENTISLHQQSVLHCHL